MADIDMAMAGFNILPVGFSAHEKATIETFFRLASQRAPHWAVSSRLSDARVVLFSASSQQDVDAFKSTLAVWQQVIILGNSDFGTGWPVVSRPLKLTAILHVLDQTVKAVATLKLAAVTPPKIRPVPAAATFELNEAPSFDAASLEVDILRNTPSKNANNVLGRVLIVDDSDIALKFMQNRLRHFGYESELARSGEEALALVGKQSYQFVFLDVMMAGMDGYKACRAIKNNKARRGPPPVVVMLTSRGGAIDKIRGAMAGCDAYLTKPLNEKQLAKVLVKHDDSTVLQRWDALHPKKPLVEQYASLQRS